MKITSRLSILLILLGLVACGSEVEDTTTPPTDTSAPSPSGPTGPTDSPKKPTITVEESIVDGGTSDPVPSDSGSSDTSDDDRDNTDTDDGSTNTDSGSTDTDGGPPADPPPPPPPSIDPPTTTLVGCVSVSFVSQEGNTFCYQVAEVEN